jgi:hypothetical protein
VCAKSIPWRWARIDPRATSGADAGFARGTNALPGVPMRGACMVCAAARIRIFESGVEMANSHPPPRAASPPAWSFPALCGEASAPCYQPAPAARRMSPGERALFDFAHSSAVGKQGQREGSWHFVFWGKPRPMWSRMRRLRVSRHSPFG